MDRRHGALAACTAILLVLVLATCESDESPTGPNNSVEPGTLDDWIAFDESKYYAKSTGGYSTEPHRNGDYIIGERFIDVNGNGVYDYYQGIDIFVMSNDSTNMDVNDNGKYDGPDDPWTPGVPYDDLNGNGIYDDPLSDMSYDAGELFLDLNGNGVWDDHGASAVQHWLQYDTDLSTTRWCLEYCDSVGVHTSDSGRQYWLPDKKSIWWWDYALDRPLRDTTWVFEVSDSGLVFVSSQWNTRLHVLPSGDVPLDTSRVTLPRSRIGDSASYLKTVTLDEQLVYCGDTLDGLLCVKFEDGWVSTYYDWEFFFARDHGVFAVTARDQWTYLPSKIDSLPLPLTGWSWSGDGTIDSPHSSAPFPLSEGCWWTYVRTLNGLPQDTVRVEVVGTDSLPDNTPVFNISNSFGLPYGQVTDDAIYWYNDLADNEPECTWQLPFVAGAELGDCKSPRGHSFRQVIGREDSPGTYATFGNCWNLELDVEVYQFYNQIGFIDTIPAYAWLAEGVGIVELVPDSMLWPPWEQRVSNRFVLIDFDVKP